MKTPEEIKEALRTCTSTGCGEAYCAYEHDGDCSGSVMRDSLALIEQLEDQIDLMKIQMQGDCGVCKHKAHDDACLTCLTLPDKPLWEYEGLPEVKA